MNVDKIKQQLDAELRKTATHLSDAQIKLEEYQKKVQDLEREMNRLQNAYNALDASAPQIVPFNVPKVPVAPSIEIKEGSNEVIVDGVQFVLEPGFEIVKNKAGEPCMVPIGTQPQEEIELPPVVRKAESLGGGDFDSPESML